MHDDSSDLTVDNCPWCVCEEVKEYGVDSLPRYEGAKRAVHNHRKGGSSLDWWGLFVHEMSEVLETITERAGRLCL